jgi:hypothetical protein
VVSALAESAQVQWTWAKAGAAVRQFSGAPAFTQLVIVAMFAALNIAAPPAGIRFTTQALAMSALVMFTMP